MDFSEAMRAVLDGKKIKRSVWGGYWFIPKQLPVVYSKNSEGWFIDDFIMNKMIIAKQKDGRGYSPAMPYPDDMLANDWEIIN